MKHIKKLTNYLKSKKNKQVNKKGFTLIELLICIAVLAILSVYTIDLIASSTRLYRRQTTQTDIQERTSVVLNTVGDVFKNAKTVTVNDSGSTMTIISQDVKNDESETDKWTKIDFDKANQKIYISYVCDSEDKNIRFSNYLLQDGVTAFTVSNGNKDTEISLTLTKDGRSYTEKANAYVRNTNTHIGYNKTDENEG